VSEITLDWQDQLIKKYPKIFPKTFYFECGEGWYELLDNACGLIQSHIDYEISKNKDIDAEAFQVIATQVKEKFGGLRFYVNHSDKYITGVINFAESMSYNICEVCGDKAVKRDSEEDQDSYWSFGFAVCEKHSRKEG
jgi:hypothetical protein